MVSALEACSDDLTMDFVQQQLINHEQKLKTEVSKSEAQQDSALVRALRQKSGTVKRSDTFKISVRNASYNQTTKDDVKSESDGEVKSRPESSDGEGAFPLSRSAEVPNDRWLKWIQVHPAT